MSSTHSTAHRRDFCRALYLQPSNTKSPHANHPNFISAPLLHHSNDKFLFTVIMGHFLLTPKSPLPDRDERDEKDESDNNVNNKTPSR